MNLFFLLIALGAAVVLFACIAVAWPWIRLPRAKPETLLTIAECAAAALAGAAFVAAAVATGVL